MAIPGLAAALSKRRAVVDATQGSTTTGFGTGGAGSVTTTLGDKARRRGFTFVDRSPTDFVGLANQGATCYLNSFIQMLFMTPEFRKALFGETIVY